MGGFIDLKKLLMVRVKGFSIISTCGIPGGGR